MPIFDHFGIIAPFYEKVIQIPDTEKLVEILDLPVEGPLLDAGGGTGRVAQVLRDFANPVVVVDLSRGMLGQAAAKPGLQTAQSHTERLPFPDGTFERVIMVDALHHVCDQKETACELWRVLKPGGRMVIEEPDLRYFPVKLIALAEKLALMRSHFLPPPGIADLFAPMNARTAIFQDRYNAYVLVEK